MQLYNKKEDCYGCGACMNICPKNAITMRADEQGFLYPQIENKLCIACGLCKKSCQINKAAMHQNEASKVCYGVKNTDDIRAVSSSGGVFTAIMEMFLDDVCVGAAFDSKMRVEHKIARLRRERDELRGSKYIQSDMGHIHKQIKELLKDGDRVLFSGTPCQVAGLYEYLLACNADTTNLYSVDLVCHGAPSPKVWEDYVKTVESKYHARIEKYTFRNKKSGWRGYHVHIDLSNGQSVPENSLTQSFAVIFGKEIMLRPSCYYCPYASMKRCGDITIGDFWGIEKIDTEFSDNKGVSMVLVNTEKGEKLYTAIKGSLTVKEYPSELLTQPNLRKSTDYGCDYDDFWRKYLSNGYRSVAKTYGGYGLLRKIRYYQAAIRRKLMK